MKYLKITTVVYDPKEIEGWINSRLLPDEAKRFKRVKEFSIKRDESSTTFYQLLDDK